MLNMDALFSVHMYVREVTSQTWWDLHPGSVDGILEEYELILYIYTNLIINILNANQNVNYLLDLFILSSMLSSLFFLLFCLRFT
jgi:hypothetical protein